MNKRVNAENIFLEKIPDAPKNNNSKIALYFSANINDCFALKTLLQKTQHEILVYYFDKTKYQINDNNYIKEQKNTIQILEYYNTQYRNFTFQEIPINQNYLNNISLEDPLLHCELLYHTYQELGEFDYYLFTQDRSFFNDQFRVIEIYDEWQKQNLPVTLITPFIEVNQEAITIAALNNNLTYYDINFDKIYNDNINFIEALKLFHDKKESKTNLDSALYSKSDLDLIYQYLIYFSNIDICVTFLKEYGENLSKDLYIHYLSNVILFTPSREDLITLSVVQGNITDNELNQILKNIVDYFANYESRTTQDKIDQIDYFFRIYEHKITEETKDYLMWKSYGWRNWYNKPLLEKLVNWSCDVGELLLRVIDEFENDIKEKSAITLLNKYHKKIHPLQLNEALLKAFSNKTYQLCYQLISFGADRKILQFHKSSYGWDLWNKEKSPDIKLERSYWRSKDRIIIKEILKELGNPQDKIPPVIHVTGSNGKGSTCAFLRSILENNGYKTHVFTSPAIIRDNENCILAGEEITDEDYYNYLKKSEEAFNKIQNQKEFKDKIDQANQEDGLSHETIKKDGYLSWSFIIPAIMLAFSKTKADATIIEVITGGEHDLTNIFSEKNTLATIINTIIYGDNHATLKGFENIENVAKTKSRLAKNKIPIICAEQEDTVIKEIKNTAKEKNCPLFIKNQDWTVEESGKNHFIYKGFGKEFKLQKPQLIGDFQINNAALAITALLQNQDRFVLDEKKTSKSVRKAYHIGRFSEINNKLLSQYKKTYFGSLKTSNGVKSFINSNSGGDAIFMSTTDDSFAYSISYLDNNLLNSFNNKLFILNDVNSNLRNPNTKLLNILIRKIDDLTIKKYLSSGILLISQTSNKKLDQILSIFSTGINSFNDRHLVFLQLIQQKNFQKDLNFAINNNLLERSKILFMTCNQKKLSLAFSPLASNDITKFYDKRFLKDSYNLSSYTKDEETSILKILNNISKTKDHIKILDYGCGDGRLLNIYIKFLENYPNKSITLYASDLSIEGMNKYKENLISRNFIENKTLKSLSSSTHHLEIRFIQAKINSYHHIIKKIKCDLSIVVGVVTHILGNKNRTKLYDFLGKISDYSLITSSFNSFKDQEQYFNNLRQEKILLTEKQILNDNDSKRLKKINMELKNALDDGEFFYNPSWVRGYQSKNPEDSNTLMPFVNLNEKNLGNDIINNSCFINAKTYIAPALSGYHSIFVEVNK